MLINLPVDVSSVALMNCGQANGCTYRDTCIEPWANYYDNSAIPVHERTNYFLRYSAQENAQKWAANGPSAVVTHGANPGLIRHFVKQALLEIAETLVTDATQPSRQQGGAAPMQNTAPKVNHVPER